MMRTILIVYCLTLFCTPLKAQQSWQELTALADSLDSEREHSTALMYREQAIAQAKNEPESVRKELQALQQFSLAESFFWKTRRPDNEAYLLMQDAIALFEEAGTNAARVSRAYKRLSENAFDFMFLPEDAEAYLEKAFDYYEKSTLKDTLYLADMMEFSGFMGVINRRFAMVIEQSERGLALLDQVNAPAEEVNARKNNFLYNLSLVNSLQFLNQPIKEYHYTVESEKIQMGMEQPDMEGLIMTYRKLALLEKDQGNYPKAEAYIERAWRLHEENASVLRESVGFKTELALSIASLTVYAQKDGENKIQELLERVEGIAKKQVLDEVEKANVKGFLNHYSRYYINKEQDTDLSHAKTYNAKALAIQIDDSKAPYPLHSFHLTSRIIEAQIAAAEKKYTKALQLINAIADPAHFSDLVLSLKVEVLLQLKREEEAYEAINQLLIFLHPINKNINFPHGDHQLFQPNSDISIAKIFTQLAEVFKQHDSDKSHEVEMLYWMAMIQFEQNLFHSVLNEEQKKIYDIICSGLIEAALERGFSIEDHNRLLTFIERLTSQDLIQNYLLKREIAGSTGLYQLVEKEQQIRSLITYLKKTQQTKDDESIKQQLLDQELEL
ncbi:MAG TPA: hypothetical protein VFD72_05165, partial [Sphingobacteriaceae bacterium]|nr:hypothetical protein [Sphingobacteriaceae bacterium]